VTVDPWGWPTPDGDGEVPPTPDPGEPDLPTMWMVALMRVGAL
jgi:hypothetical protein